MYRNNCKKGLVCNYKLRNLTILLFLEATTHEHNNRARVVNYEFTVLIIEGGYYKI